MNYKIFILLIIFIFFSANINGVQNPFKHLTLNEYRSRSLEIKGATVASQIVKEQKNESNEIKEVQNIKSKEKIDLRIPFLRSFSFSPYLFFSTFININVPNRFDWQEDAFLPPVKLTLCDFELVTECDNNKIVEYLKGRPEYCSDSKKKTITDCSEDYDPECKEGGCEKGLIGAHCKEPKPKKDADLNPKCLSNENPCVILFKPEDKAVQPKCCIPGKTEKFKINEKIAGGIIDLAKEAEKGDELSLIKKLGSVCAATLASELLSEERSGLIKRIREITKFGPFSVGGSPEKAEINYDNPDCPHQKISVGISQNEISFSCETKF